MIKQSINNLLETEMDRKDFLKMVGLGLAAVVGVGQVVSALSKAQHSKQTSRLPSASDYGQTAYGG
jgi:hypothetical protein